MTTEHLHPLNFLLFYKFTPAQTFNLPFADRRIPLNARFLPFSVVFHILGETLNFLHSHSSTAGLTSCFQPDRAHYTSVELIIYGLVSLQEV